MTIPTPEDPTTDSSTPIDEDSSSIPIDEASSSISEVDPNRKSGFLGETYEELKLVVWPSRQQLFSESIAVILMVTLSAAAIAAVSRFYSWGASQIFGSQ